MTARFDPDKITFFAKTDARGQHVPFGIKAIDRQKHMYVIGKTGMGKSTLLENMAVQDMRGGEGMAFIDPHGATAETLLDYIPEERKDDVLYFAPFDMDHPVSFNVMEDVGPDKRHLVVSGLMSVFEKIWVDAWSARMAYILQNTLMALLEYPDSTLLGVNRMLSDKNYRKKVVDNINDPSVKSFWVDEFAKYNERYMQEAGDAIKNKIGQFTANPLIRNIIGQPKSSFDLRTIMDEQKIVIMNLSKGLVGESNANLLGSMLTTRIYLAAMSRADLPQHQLRELPNFYFYVDEFQSFANATFADILSEARKYKLNLTIAHQYIEQMEEEVKNAVFGNVGTIASFRVGPFDAEILETIFAPQFQAIDICNLGFAQIYLTLMIDGVGSQPFSAVTLPPLEKPSVSCRDIIIHSSRQNYARPRAEVEESIISWHGQSQSPAGNQNTKQNESPKKPQNKNQPPARPYPEKGNTGHTDKNNNRSRQNQRKTDAGTSETTHTPKKNGGHNQKQNLDALRSVLAGISEKTEDKKTTTNTHKNEKKQPQSNDGQGSTAKSRTDTPKHTQQKSGAHLKEALADVLNTQSENTGGQKNSTTDSAAPKNTTTPTTQTPSRLEYTTEHENARSKKQDDALDPKKLERMMKVRSDDKTPLK